MKMRLVCLKLWSSIAVLLLLFRPAQCQEKYFRITDDGKYYFFNDATIEQNTIVNGKETYTRPITPRTFFLEGRKANLFPDGFTFSDFQKLTIAEQQQLLDSLQQDFDWSKYKVQEKTDTVKSPPAIIDPTVDTTYSIQNLAFDKESLTLVGEMVSGAGRKQQFMVYPASTKYSNENVLWIIEWVEPAIYLKRKGYKDLKLPEARVYQALVEIGVDMKVLNSLLK